jgi:type IV pilus assembly protein PilB
MSAQLETFLLKTGLMTPRELEAAVEEADRAKIPLWDAVVKDTRLSEELLADTFARWFNLPRVKIASVTVEPEAVHKIDDKLARKHICLPVKIEGKSLLVAVANPLDYQAIQDVEFRSGIGVRPLIATRTEIIDGIDVHFASEERIADFLNNVQDSDELHIVTDKREEVDPEAASRSAAEVPPVVKMCNLILHDAIKMGASDVHVEPGLNDVQVRLRIDGVLRDYTQVPKWLHTPVVSRLKILAELDISERRLPQDGRINVQYQGKPVDIRVSTLPTHFGEKIVLRVLGSSTIPTIDVMGFSAPQAAIVETALSQPQGMIIVTGPTGSGKSTTLYSMIEQRKSPEVNIVTVEDPIEYQLGGITQVQVNVRSGLTFASALRSILRQDPDVILVGEVRDPETAEIAFQAAITGHLVLTTLHTNSSLATIARLLDLGVDPFTLASSVNMVIAQRLARRICPRCKENYEPEADVLERLKIDKQAMVFRRGYGCQMCGNSGFAGRTGIYEVLRLTPQLKDMIHHRASEGEMRTVAAASGMRLLLDEALRKVILGQTTPEEVLRVIRLDEEQEQEVHTCPKCLARVEASFSTCPYCLHMLKRVCAHCGQELKLEWKACPYCHHKVRLAGSPSMTPTQIPEGVPPAVASLPPAFEAGQGTPRSVAAMPPRYTPDGHVIERRRSARPPVPPASASPVAPATQPAAATVAQAPATATAAAPAPDTPTWRDHCALPAPGEAAAGEAQSFNAVAPGESAPPAKKLRILAVDDDAEMRKLIQEALANLPFPMQVTEAADGDQALEVVESIKPDLIILDIMMPRVDGFEVCQKLRENVRTAFVPIMMLTASADETSRTTGFLLGTDDYVTKPFSVTDLNARVMRLLRRTYGM